MRASSLVIGAILTLGTCVARAALPLITIDPNNYSTGQIITDPTGEGQFSALSAYQNLDPNAPIDQAYILQGSAVFASLANPVCPQMYLGGPCAPSGDKLFGWSPVGYASNWGDAANAVRCGSLTYCNPMSAQAFFFPVLEIDFTRLTNFVAAQIGFINDPDGGWIEAFNSTGQSVGYCEGTLGGIGGSPGNENCGSYPDPSDPAWPQYSITDSNRDISTVLIGGNANWREIGRVQYSVPEPGPFGLLALGVAVIGLSRLVRRRRAVS